MPLEEFTVSLLWHPRMDADPVHKWLRECIRDVCRATLRGHRNDAGDEAEAPALPTASAQTRRMPDGDGSRARQSRAAAGIR